MSSTLKVEKYRQMRDGAVIVESVETLPLRQSSAADGGSISEARIVYNPCDYLNSYVPSSSKEVHEGEYWVQTTE